MTYRILLVDDSAVVRRALAAALISRGFEICGEAENGQVAIDRAVDLHPDAIVLDVSMPVMHGLDAARILRRVMPDLPVLLYSSFAASTLRREASAAGVQAVVGKAQPLDVLVQSLESLLQKSDQSNGEA